RGRASGSRPGGPSRRATAAPRGGASSSRCCAGRRTRCAAPSRARSVRSAHISSTQVIPEPVARSVPLRVMKLIEKVAAISGSAHTGRALKAAKFLNLVGTVRGAITTVLLASSAIGGAVTVNNVRQDLAQNQANVTATSRPTNRVTPAPTPTPLTAVGLKADAQKRLQTGLDQNAQAADDLRKVSILDASSTDALVAVTRQKLQARFDQALVQIDALIAVSTAAPSGTPQPTASLSVVAVNSLVQVALGDMNGIL